VLKSSHATVSDSTATTTRMMASSWRQGLTHWLQMSRASAAAAAAAVASGNQNSTNNNIDASPSHHHRRGSSAKRRRQQQQASKNNSQTPSGVVRASAPMTISVVTNHGLVRTATGVVLPNSIVVHRPTSTAKTNDDVTVDCDVISDAESPAMPTTAVTQIVMTSSTPVHQYGERKQALSNANLKQQAYRYS
jgi:hypothetical protein